VSNKETTPLNTAMAEDKHDMVKVKYRPRGWQKHP